MWHSFGEWDKFYRENRELNTAHISTICNLLAHCPGMVHSYIHTAQSLPANIQSCKASCAENFPTGFMGSDLIIPLHSTHSHYAPYLKPLWKRPFISRHKLSEEGFMDRNTPILFGKQPGKR